MPYRLLAHCCLTLTLLLPSLFAGRLAAAEAHVLSTGRKVGDLSRVTVKIEVGGDLKVMEKSKVKPLKMSVVGTIAYDEMLVAGERGQVRGVRYYDQAEATIKIENGGAKPVLRADRRLIGVDWSGQSVQLYSPRGSLTREELDLIDVPGNSLLLDMLLPDGPVALDGQWRIAETTLAPLLGLDVVSTSDVQCTLKEVAADVAKAEFSGNVAGAVQGVATEIEVKGRLHFNLKHKRMSFVGLAIKEKRPIGHVQTGIDAVARLQITLTDLKQSKQLTRDAVAEATSGGALHLPLLLESTAGQFSLRCDRRWHVVNDDPKLLTLRFVDRGDLVAQCNVAVLDKVEPGQQIALSKFQSEIQQKLGATFGQFLQASESVLPEGYTKYRVTAMGTVAELPIEWRYYLLFDASGRQVAFAFTLEQSLVERFADADAALVATLGFQAPKAETAANPVLKKTK